MEGHYISDDFPDELLLSGDIKNDLSFWTLIEKWQETLSLLLILYERNELQQYGTQFIERIRCLNACFVWHELQPVAVYKALCGHLLGQSVRELEIHQYASGAVPLEWGGHWSWGSVPHSRFHAELGVLWCLHGQLTEDNCYFKAAEALAEWQLNTLDHNCLPLVGLFSQEEDFSESRLLINNFLLFNAVSIFADRSDMASIAEKQYARITTLSSAAAIEFSPLQLVLNKWLSKYPKPSSVLPTLPSFFKDEQLILAGCRSISGSAVSTLSGGGSGMGSMYRGDVQIVCFGPQHLPLGDCRSFGIESQQDHLSQSQIKISTADKMYGIQGLARVSSHPKTSPLRANFRNGEHCGIWIDTKQHFQDEQLTIEATFRGLFDVSTLAFVFFVKARSCAIENLKVVNLRSFERYQGEVKNIILHGEQTILMIEAGQRQGGMEVIPLGGGNSFWGADFLIAYPLVSQRCKYSWVLK